MAITVISSLNPGNEVPYMPMTLAPSEILETVKMLQLQNLDIRTITMGISLRLVAATVWSNQEKHLCHITSKAKSWLEPEGYRKEYGIPIINKKISVTPWPSSPTVSGLTKWWNWDAAWTKPPGSAESTSSADTPLWFTRE